MMQEAILAAVPPRNDAAEETTMSDPVPIQANTGVWQDLLVFRDKVFCLCLGFAGNGGFLFR